MLTYSLSHDIFKVWSEHKWRSFTIHTLRERGGGGERGERGGGGGREREREGDGERCKELDLL